jgi:hypothetical protein
MVTKVEKDLNYFKQNAEEDYMKTPISVLRYITELEQRLEEPNAKEIGSSGVGSPTGTLALSGSIRVGSLIKQEEQ